MLTQMFRMPTEAAIGFLIVGFFLLGAGVPLIVTGLETARVRNKKPCPHCKEYTHPEASICPFCRSDILKPEKVKTDTVDPNSYYR
jgi:hypothetical protein